MKAIHLIAVLIAAYTVGFIFGKNSSFENFEKINQERQVKLETCLTDAVDYRIRLQYWMEKGGAFQITAPTNEMQILHDRPSK